MASSPTDSPGPPEPTGSPTPTQELVENIARAYEGALLELQHSDLDAVGRHLDQVDTLTAEIDAKPQLDPVDPAALARVEAHRNRLCSLIGAAQSQLGKKLQHTKQGRRALRGYGNRGPTTGNYHRSDA